jgi:SNF2 family DNA or RNA helicase
MEPGVGKSLTTVEIIRRKMNDERQVLKTLIICPPVVIRMWEREWLENTKLTEKNVLALVGTGKQRVDKLLKRIKDAGPEQVVITNYESLLMDGLLGLLRDWGPEVMVLDESQRIKNHSAKRTKRAIALSAYTRYRYILTGTPVLNSPMDLFAQFLFLDGGVRLSANFYHFRARYFYDKNAYMPRGKHFPNWVVRPDTEKHLGELISSISFQAKKSECLTLPPLVEQELEVELSPAQRKSYDEMLRHFITFVNEQAVSASLAITKSLRLQQIVSGFVQPDGEEPINFKENPRLAALGDLIEDIAPDHKVIVWTNFKATYKMIGEMLTRMKIEHCFLTGEESQKEKDASIEAFQNGTARVIVSNPAAGGVGVTLTAASYSIWYSRSFNLEHEIQASARNYRGGSERHESITRIDLVAPGTLDQEIMRALKRKEDMAEVILNYAKSR